jgi:hypothetical protein
LSVLLFVEQTLQGTQNVILCRVSSAHQLVGDSPDVSEAGTFQVEC